jgi:hypothetical protein
LTDEEVHEAILAKAQAMYGLRRRCKHANATLVQHIDWGVGWFMCYQCDDCGQILQREVTAEQLETKEDVPWLDETLYEQATTEREPGEKVGRAMAFFGKAIK